MSKTIINAKIVAHSLSPQGDELISVLAVFPRIILAEVNTHRMLSKNTSSSRAIPFNKMVEAVQNDPFIPIAWQKHHSGMQGSEYLSKTHCFNLNEFVSILSDTLNSMLDYDSKEYKELKKQLDEKISLIQNLLQSYTDIKDTIDNWWLFARDKAVEAATILYVFNVTKQLCNRLLEPFMWTTMLITGSREGWDNFFKLRCPSYEVVENKVFKSRKDAFIGMRDYDYHCPKTDLQWLSINKGQAEIHMMGLAECIWDAVNESKPRQLYAGDWHIPFANLINEDEVYKIKNKPLTEFDLEIFGDDATDLFVKISTAMGARTSYTVVGDEKEVNYTKMVELHDRLINQVPPHSSPLEHCAKAMSDEEYSSFLKGKIKHSETKENFELSEGSCGWCNNFKGFIQYRYIIDNNNISSI